MDESMESEEIEAAKVLHRFFVNEVMLIIGFSEIHGKKACPRSGLSTASKTKRKDHMSNSPVRYKIFIANGRVKFSM